MRHRVLCLRGVGYWGVRDAVLKPSYPLNPLPFVNLVECRFATYLPPFVMKQLFPYCQKISTIFQHLDTQHYPGPPIHPHGSISSLEELHVFFTWEQMVDLEQEDAPVLVDEDAERNYPEVAGGLRLTLPILLQEMRLTTLRLVGHHVSRSVFTGLSRLTFNGALTALALLEISPSRSFLAFMCRHWNQLRQVNITHRPWSPPENVDEWSTLVPFDTVLSMVLRGEVPEIALPASFPEPIYQTGPTPAFDTYHKSSTILCDGFGYAVEVVNGVRRMTGFAVSVRELIDVRMGESTIEVFGLMLEHLSEIKTLEELNIQLFYDMVVDSYATFGSMLVRPSHISVIIFARICADADISARISLRRRFTISRP